MRMSRRSFFIVSRVPVLTAADTWDTFCRTVGFLRYLGYVLSYRWLGLGLTNRYLDNDNNDESHPKNSFLSGSLHFGIKLYCSDEDESSKLPFFFERSYCCWYVLSYRRFFVVKGSQLLAVGTYTDWFYRIPGIGWAPTSNPSIFRAFSAQPQQVLDCTGKNWFRAAPEDRIPKIPAFSE